ncbi:MAG: PAS domain S-box protein [Prolixibacteraceae bacterium]|nr:PAS domain S-box protein [Prolixibacteraceae bacterium]
MKFKVKIKFQLLLISCLVAILVLLTGFLYFQGEKEATRQDKYIELQAIAILKSNQLSQWQRERMSEARFFSTGQLYTELTAGILRGEEKFKENYSKSLTRIMSDNRYDNIFMIDKRGNLLFSVVSGEVIIDSALIDLSIEITQKKEIIKRDLYYSQVNKKIYLDFLAPIFDNQGEVVTILVFRVDPEDYLFPLIENWPTPSKTAESILARREGDSIRILNNLKHKDNSGFNVLVSIEAKDYPSVNAVLGRTGIFEGIDYAGNKVLCDLCSIPMTSWYMVTKQDESEIYKDVNKQAVLIFIVILLTIFSIGALLAWIYNKNQRDIFRELLEKSFKLNQSQGESSAILYSIGDAVITTDIDGIIRQINPVAERMTGLKEKEAIGKNFDEVINIVNELSREKVLCPIRDIIKEGKSVSDPGQNIIISTDGEEIPVDENFAPIKDSENNLFGAVIILRDQREERVKRKLIDTRLCFYEFARTHSLKETLTFVLDTIGEIIKSPLGFLYFIDEDQSKSYLRVWSSEVKNRMCKIDLPENDNYIQQAGVWADSLRLRKTVTHNDYESLPNKKGMPEGHLRVIREMVVPVIRNNKVTMLLGIGNKPTDYTEEDSEFVNYLADIAWVIAEQKINEERLRESEEKYKELIDGMNETVWVIDFDGDLIDVNKSTERVLGYTKEELLEVGLAGVDCSLKKEMIVGMAASMEEDFMQIFETTHKSKDGRVIPVEVYSSIINYHGKKSILSIARDISDRKKSEEQIRQEKLLLRTLIDNLPDAIYVKDKEGRKLIANSVDLRMMHKKYEEEVIGKTDIEIFNFDYEQAGFDEDMLVINSGQKIINKENEYFDEHGNLRWRLISKIPLYNDKDEIIGLVGFSHDFTERKLMEIQRSQMIRDLIKAKDKAEESDRLKTAFLANVSHEIRTPMNGILGFLELLNEPDLEEVQKEMYLDIMTKSGQRLLDTINDIVELARIESGQLEMSYSAVDLKELMDYHFNFFKPKSESQKINLNLEFNVPSDFHVLNIDKNKLDSVISNLLNNAFKYTKQGSIVFGVSKEKDGLMFFVKDTGPGIPEEKIDEIFKRFVQADQYTTRSQEGSGLGLSISKAYVEVMNGKIWVESEVGKGSTFYFSIPSTSV